MSDSTINELFYINDGSGSYLKLSGASLSEQVGAASQYFNCDHGDYSCHAPLLKMTAERCATILDECNEWVNGFIADAEYKIVLKFADGNSCNARAGRFKGESGGRSCIEINLGTISRLLGCANRVLQMFDNNYLLTGDASAFGGDFDRDWDPLHDPIGMLTFNYGVGVEPTLELTTEAIRLVYFHEAAHLLAAHPFLPIMREWYHIDYHRYKRAVEAEADFGAGWLYTNYEQDRSRIVKSRWVAEDSTKQFIMAGVCVYIAFQLDIRLESVGKQYHLPFVRLQCTLSGADSWHKLHSSFDFFKVANDLLAFLPADYIYSQMVPHWLSFSSKLMDKDKISFEEETRRLFADIRNQTITRRAATWLLP